METWQLVSVITSVILAGAAVLGLLWKAMNQLDTKIGARIDKLVDENHSLGREFSELKGEIRTRFAMQDKESFQEIVDTFIRKTMGGKP